MSGYSRAKVLLQPPLHQQGSISNFAPSLDEKNVNRISRFLVRPVQVAEKIKRQLFSLVGNQFKYYECSFC